MKAPPYHGKCTDGEGIVVVSLCMVNKMHQRCTHFGSNNIFSFLSVCYLRLTQVPHREKRPTSALHYLFLKHYLFFKHIIKRPNCIALSEPTPLNLFFRISQVGLSLKKKCLLWLLKTLNSFQWFLSPAAIARVLSQQ